MLFHFGWSLHFLYYHSHLFIGVYPTFPCSIINASLWYCSAWVGFASFLLFLLALSRNRGSCGWMPTCTSRSQTPSHGGQFPILVTSTIEESKRLVHLGKITLVGRILKPGVAASNVLLFSFLTCASTISYHPKVCSKMHIVQPSGPESSTRKVLHCHFAKLGVYQNNNNIALIVYYLQEPILWKQLKEENLEKEIQELGIETPGRGDSSHSFSVGDVWRRKKQRRSQGPRALIEIQQHMKEINQWFIWVEISQFLDVIHNH